MRTVFIHPGLHKTGSTAIQQRLRRGATSVAGRLQVFSRLDKGSNNLSLPCRRYHTARWLDQPRQARKAANDIKAAVAGFLEQVDPNGPAVLLTDEFLSGKMVGLSDCWELFPYLPEIAEILLEALQPADVKFVVYIRDLERWKKSAYNQSVRTDFVSLSYEDWAASISEDQSLETPVVALKDRVGHDRVIQVVMEEDAKEETGLGTALFREVGLPFDVIAHLPAVSSANESFPPRALEFVRRLNEFEHEPPVRRALIRAIRRNLELFAD